MQNQFVKEKQLVRNIVNGDLQLFEELIHRYQKLVVSIVMRFTKNHYEMEEVCQEIFIKIFQKLAQFKFKSKLSTWIGKITFNHCLNYAKRNSRQIQSGLSKDFIDNGDKENILKSNEKNFQNRLEEDETFSLIEKGISQLPELYQTILTLYHIQDMSYSEISEILELPEGTVKSYLFRSRKLLKQKLLSSYTVEEFVL